jgi:hypothetical protein
VTAARAIARACTEDAADSTASSFSTTSSASASRSGVFKNYLCDDNLVNKIFVKFS